MEPCEIIERFKACWRKFQCYYMSQNPLPVETWEGMQARTIWNEADVAFHLARFAAEGCLSDWVHLEATITGMDLCEEYKKKYRNSPIDLVLCDPNRTTGWSAAKNPDDVKESLKKLKYDLVVEIKIVIEKSRRTSLEGSLRGSKYSIKGVEYACEKLKHLRPIAPKGIVCVVDKANKERDVSATYRNMEKKYGVEVMDIYDHPRDKSLCGAGEERS